MTVIDWLLDSDPSIRWQVMRDLTHEPADVIAAERSRIATEGWGARLLALQAPDGRWGGRPWSHDWTDTFHVLELLRRLGLDPESEQARRAVGLVREHVTWRDPDFETPWADNRFFEGEVEPCINGNIVATGAYFGVDMTPLVDRLLGEQLPDGGWNCEVENGATVSSIGDDDQRARGPAGVRAGDRRLGRGRGGPPPRRGVPARARPVPAEVDRRGDRLHAGSGSRSRTGTTTTSCAALDYLRAAGVAPDERVAEAIEVVEGNRDPDGRWPLQNVHAGEAHLEMEDGEGEPSRWNTLRAMRVLDWFAQGG